VGVLTILQQLGVDGSFFWQLGIFVVLWLTLSKIFFGPFHALIEKRHQRTVEDREAAERLVGQAEQKLEEYRKLILAAKEQAKKDADTQLEAARAEEQKVLAEAREQAKAITQSALKDLEQQKSKLQGELQSHVDELATQVAARVLQGGR